MIARLSHCQGTIDAMPSKSVLHRRSILNALAGVLPTEEAPCADVAVTLDCLSHLHTDRRFDCKESGSTLRFLLPVSLLFGGGSFDGAPSLRARPMQPLCDALKDNGVEVSSDTLPFTAKGTLQAGVYTLSGDVSSQYLSGLLLALPFCTGDSEIRLTTPLQSRGYLELTIQELALHGVAVERTPDGFHVQGGQSVKAVFEPVEGDWSCAAPFLTLGAIQGPITVRGLDVASLQPDRGILHVIRLCGGHVSVSQDAVTVSHGALDGFKWDGSDAPDLAPILAALACASHSESVLYRVGRLRFKESDRLTAILELLSSLGGSGTLERADSLLIDGFGSLKGGKAQIPPDHRMVMAATLLSAIAAQPVEVPFADCVQKSYPQFFSDLLAVGGDFDGIHLAR